MTIDEMIAVLQAAKEGKKIQCFMRDGTWQDCDLPSFTEPMHNYRVKPDPREWKVVVSDDGKYVDSPRHGEQYSTQLIRVREVLQ